MHGGRSTGPRTEQGMARLRAARTVHGAYDAETRARNRHVLTVMWRGQVVNAALDCFDLLPSDLAARLMEMPDELMPPPCPCDGLTPGQDRAVLRAEADALAPWRAAIAHARQAGRGGGRRAATPGRRGAWAGAHAPVACHDDPAVAWEAAGQVDRHREAKAHAPDRACDDSDAAPAAAQAASVATSAKAHAPDRATDGRGAVPATAPAAPGDKGQQPEEAHAPEGVLAACHASQAALLNRAARRRWKSLQRHTHPGLAACPYP